MFQRLITLILHGRWPILLGLILTTLLMGQTMMELTIDPSTEPLFIKRSPEYQAYKEFNEKFGSDYMIAVAMETPDLFSDPYLQDLKELTDAISEYPQVERVMSLSNVLDIRHRFFGVRVVPALKDYYKGDDKAVELKEVILGNELYRNNFVSADGRIANILIYLKPSGSDRKSGGKFMKRLQGLLEKYERNEMKFYIAGAPVEQYRFIQYIRKDQFIFVPVITLLLIIATWVIYRNFSCVILAMSIVFMTLIWTMGAIVLFGQELNLVTSLLAPVIMIVAIVNSIHLMNLFFEIRFHHKSLRQAVVLTMTELGAPCFLTHFTTILGFLSLALNPVPAIQGFGVFAALGTLFSYVIEILLTPILMPILPYRQERNAKVENFFNKFLVEYLEKLEFRWKWWIIAAGGLVLILSLAGIRKLHVDTSLIKQMKPDSPLAVATRFIDNHLTGVYVLGFVLRKKDGSEFMDYESLIKIDQLKEFLESQPEIVKVNSLTTFIKKINEARGDEDSDFVIPNDEDKLRKYFNGLRESEDPGLWKMIAPDFRMLRLEARMKAVGTQEGALLEEKIKAYMDRTFLDDFEYHFTGNVVLLGKMAKGLVRYQMRGFVAAFAAILLLISIMFRSIRVGLLAAVPNILPILAIYGFMGFVGIDLSSPTAMISSIVLGMVVDASIHFLHRFRIEFHKRHHYIQALHHTFRNVGQSLVVSTLILCIGFASSIFASFKPTIYLGLLTSLTIFFALICTLVILPVCLVMIKPFGKGKIVRRPLSRSN